MRIKCVVSCRDANGTPSFYPCTITVSKAGYDNGDHYDKAAEKANDAGYENVGLTHDEKDGPSFLFDHFFPKCSCGEYTYEDRMGNQRCPTCDDHSKDPD